MLGDDGFTLIELLIVVAILPIVIGGIAVGLLSVFSLQDSVSNRLSDSGDAQVVSANFVQDVQSALEITTSATTTGCGSGTQLFGLEWNYDSQTGTYLDVVSYSLVADGSKDLLVREYCADGASPSATSTTTLSTDVSSSLGSPTIDPSSDATAASVGWSSTNNVTDVNWSVTEPASGYTYSLTATPEVSAAPNSGGSPLAGSTATSCGFPSTYDVGTGGNGTYDTTLCLFDFGTDAGNGGYDASEAAAPGCQEMSGSAEGGAIVLSFCIQTSGTGPLIAAQLPTWPGGFLGNVIDGSPFYTAVGCPANTPADYLSGTTLEPTPSCSYPALYETSSGSTNTIVITDISVQTSAGAPVSGWEFVTADAETTDPGEYIIWTSNEDLQLLDNSPSSPEGDACNEKTASGGPGPGGTFLTGLGTTTVECQSTWQSSGTEPRTGTVMLEAPEPTSLTVQMHGAGLQGIALGLLLPGSL